MHTTVDVRAAFLGQGLGNTKKLVGNNMNKVTEIYQESCCKIARKISTKQHVFSTDTFYLLCEKKISTKQLIFSTKHL